MGYFTRLGGHGIVFSEVPEDPKTSPVGQADLDDSYDKFKRKYRHTFGKERRDTNSDLEEVNTV